MSGAVGGRSKTRHDTDSTAETSMHFANEPFAVTRLYFVHGKTKRIEAAEGRG